MLKSTEDKNEKQLKVIENQAEKQLDATEKNDNFKDDKAKNKAVLKDGLKELIKSYPDSFSNFVKSELKQLPTSEENIDYKRLSEEIFLDGFSFFLSKAYILLKNLVGNKIGVNTVNDDQRDFVFDVVKGCM